MKSFTAGLNRSLLRFVILLLTLISPFATYLSDKSFRFLERNYKFVPLPLDLASSNRSSPKVYYPSRVGSLLFINPTDSNFNYYCTSSNPKKVKYPEHKAKYYYIPTKNKQSSDNLKDSIMRNRFRSQTKKHEKDLLLSSSINSLSEDNRTPSQKFNQNNLKMELVKEEKGYARRVYINDLLIRRKGKIQHGTEEGKSENDFNNDESKEISNTDVSNNLKEIDSRDSKVRAQVQTKNHKYRKEDELNSKRTSSKRKTIKDTIRSILGNTVSKSVIENNTKEKNVRTESSESVCNLDFEAPCSVPSVSESSIEEGILVPSSFTVKDTIDFLSRLAKLPKYSNDKSVTVLDSTKESNKINNHIKSGSTSLERIFVTECGQLLGYVTTLDLLLADKSSFISSIIRKSEVIVHTEDLFEEALQKMRKNGLTYAPVVTDDSKIVGIVTPSDMLNEMEYEATDDVMRTSGSGSGESYFGTSIFKIVTARAGWLISLLMLQSVSSTILTKFSTLLEKHLIIALFLTMLTGTAGNAGNQSSAMVIRGLATGEINRQNSYKVLLRELKAGVFMAILLALASFFRVYITPGSNLISTLAVSLAMGITVIGSCILGTLSPLVLEYLGQDPCNCASPALATLTDVSGVLILCLISSLLLG